MIEGVFMKPEMKFCFTMRKILFALVFITIEME